MTDQQAKMYIFINETMINNLEYPVKSDEAWEAIVSLMDDGLIKDVEFTNKSMNFIRKVDWNWECDSKIWAEVEGEE